MATGHFSGIFLSKIAGSGPDGSIDTSLKFVSRPRAEPIERQTHEHTHTHTEYGYYNIDNCLSNLFILSNILAMDSKQIKLQ